VTSTFFGAVTLAGGVVPLLIALTITRDHAWTSPEVLGLFALAIVMLVAFVFVESRVKQPIVPLHLFKNVTFSVSMVVGFLTAFGMFGSILFTPLVFQGVLGISATNSGALITPMMFGLLGASTATGFVMRRIKYYPLPWHARGGGDDRRHVDALADHAEHPGVGRSSPT